MLDKKDDLLNCYCPQCRKAIEEAPSGQGVCIPIGGEGCECMNKDMK